MSTTRRPRLPISRPSSRGVCRAGCSSRTTRDSITRSCAAEFERAGIAFAAQVVCSVMLSRKLYPDLQHHNLDALAETHRLAVEERHRALPDAELLWQWWQVIHRENARKTIDRIIAGLLTAPLLPPQLDPSLIDRLPRSPGAYALFDEEDRPLAVGAAANLKSHVLNYFRLDRATGRALEHAHRVARITWHATRGMIGARLCAAKHDAVLFADAKRRLDIPAYTWRLRPDAVPCIALAAVGEASSGEHDSYGLFPTERKARNALLRLARKHRLCRELLGLARRRVSGMRGDAVGGLQPGSRPEKGVDTHIRGVTTVARAGMALSRPGGDSRAFRRSCRRSMAVPGDRAQRQRPACHPGMQAGRVRSADLPCPAPDVGALAPAQDC